MGEYSILDLSNHPSLWSADTVNLKRKISLYCPPSHAIVYISPLTVHFPITRSVGYQHIFHTLYFTLHSARVLSNLVLTTVIEMVKILDGRVGKHSVERVRYVINNLLHLVIVKYGVISLIACICKSLYIQEKWFQLQDERAHSLKLFVF